MESIQILQKIASLQSTGDKYFAEGLFPTYRFHLSLPGVQADNSIFSTASTVFTLQNLMPYLSADEQSITQSICKKAIARYEDYRNKDGLKTYNFWKTDGSPHFPNGWLLSRMKSVRIPDDVDDTALIYMTKPSPKEDVLWLQEKLKMHANLASRQIQNTFPEYKSLKAYSTFFGKNMYIEFDACVLCNLLLLFYRNGIELDEYGKASVEYLAGVIKTNKHIEFPFYAAGSYPQPAVILYHYARLLGEYEVTGLSDLKGKIIADLKAQLKSKSLMLRLMAETALMKLGEKVDSMVELSLDYQFGNFYYYHAGMLTAIETPLARRLAPYQFVHLKYRCEAHHWALVLEHEVLKQNQ